jgi:hypothetical protein
MALGSSAANAPSVDERKVWVTVAVLNIMR